MVEVRDKIVNIFTEGFKRVGVNLGSVLSPLLFIIVLEALSMEFRWGCPLQLLYAVDLLIGAM